MKKLLALVLALVMTLGLATVGANAADFKDESSIEYEEAVNVMNGIGVIEGDDNGNFNPKGTLTREQAAKIVAYMMLGKSGADSLSATVAPFSDVAADRWSAGAISYCATEGIIAGLGDGTFNPAGKLTGHQFAKMLLVALGYDPAFEGLVGADWAVNVAKLAVSADLEEDLSIVLSQEITRDQAAMMAFNTLKADLVEYNGATNVKTNDGTEVTVNAKRDKSNHRTNLYDNRGNNNEDKFCEVYFKDLKLNDDGTNDFGEPVNKWTYKNVVISEEAKKADSTLIGTVTYQDLYKAAGDAAMSKVAQMDIYVDGVLIGTANSGGANDIKSSAIKANVDGATQKYWVKDNDDDLVWDAINGSGAAGAANGSAYGPTGNGTITTVFVDHDSSNDNYDITFAIKHVYVGKVNSVTAASGSDARKVTITGKTLPSTTTPGVTLDGDYETEQFAKDDIVLYTVAINGDNEAKIQSMEPATLVSGVEVTKTNIERNSANAVKPNKSVVTAGGKDYKLNINVKVENDATRTAITQFTAGDKFDLYLDANGLVVWAELTEEELNLNNYLVLVRGGMSSGLGTTPIADAVTLTGTKLSDITISKFDGSSVSGTTAWANMKLYTIYKYTVNGSNYELKPVTGTYTSTNGAILNANYTSGNANLPGGEVGNSNSKLVVYNMNGDKISNYTGVKNFPDVDGTKYGGASKLDNSAKGNTNQTAIDGAGYTTGGGLKQNAVQGAYTYLRKSGNVIAAVWVHNNATAMNVLIKSSVSADDIVYVTSKNYTTTKVDDKTVYTFECIKEGKVTTISTESLAICELFARDQDLYQITSYDGDYVDGVSPRVAFTSSANSGNTVFAVSNPTATGNLLEGITNTTNGVENAGDDTRWGRVRFNKTAADADYQIGGSTFSGIGVYTVDADVTGSTFKLTINDAGNNNDRTYIALATNANTKFFEISSKGVVSQIESSDFNYDALTDCEFSAIYDNKDGVANYIFFQKV